ncbi:unnamed protein product [Urochloa decumbens]|uniref:Uncharacterized protein n=1 Tax=Urochloa decumbens TaxID=240449 RepID=A0ABC8VRY2_9POAL
MASATILRSAARSLRLRQPLEQQGRLLARRAIEDLRSSTRLLSSSVPTERHKCFPSSDTRSRDSGEQKNRVNEKKDDIYQRLSTKIDKISDGYDEHMRLLKQLEVQIKENNKNHGAIDLTPWVVSIPASFLLFALYNYVQG